MKMGFIGTGIMGEPMALSLVNANTPFIAWNRATAKLKQLREAGAETADTIDMVFNKADIVILMLVDGAAIDEVIGRQTCEFADRVKNHTIVHMGTTSADRGVRDPVRTRPRAQPALSPPGRRRPIC